MSSVGIDAHLVLLFVAAPTVDFGRAFDRAHFRLDDPIVNRAQLGDVVARCRSRRNGTLRPSPVATGPIFGRSMPAASSTVARRSLISCRAK